MSLEDVVNRQAQAIRFYRKTLEELHEKLELYKRALIIAIRDLDARIPDDIVVKLDLEDKPSRIDSWIEKSRKFEGLRKVVLRTTIKLIRQLGRPVHYKEVYEYIRDHTTLPFHLRDEGIETISRRLRELAQWGYLTRPKPGYYFYGPKLVENES
jgi:hypothetical protein